MMSLSGHDGVLHTLQSKYLVCKTTLQGVVEESVTGTTCKGHVASTKVLGRHDFFLLCACHNAVHEPGRHAPPRVPVRGCSDIRIDSATSSIMHTRSWTDLPLQSCS